MNCFHLRGSVISIEEKEGKRGPFWIAKIDTGTERVKVTFFRLPTGGPLQEGESIRVEGMLGTREGRNGGEFLDLKRVEVCRERFAPSAGSSAPKNTPPDSREPPPKMPNEDDWDDLPF